MPRRQTARRLTRSVLGSGAPLSRGPSGVWNHAAPDTSQKVGKYTSELVFSQEAKLPILTLPAPILATSAGTRLPAGFSSKSVVSPRGH